MNNWPLIRDALVAEGFRDPATFLAAIATTYVETHVGDNTFRPIKELGGVAYFTANYEDNREIADQLNTQPGTGLTLRSGYIQITGRANYRNYGKVLGIPWKTIPTWHSTRPSRRVLAAYFAGEASPIVPIRRSRPLARLAAGAEPSTAG